MTNSSAHILLAEDDFYFRATLKRSLEKEGFQVTEVEDGVKAQEFLGLEDFDLVLSDIRMPRATGIEILDWVKKHKPGIPVILLTGFTEALDAKEAVERGACALIAKPFQKDELLKAIKEALAGSKKSEPGTGSTTGSGDQEYSAVSIGDFITGKEIRYNIFVKISEGHYVKIAHQGEDLPVEQIRAYRDKGLEFLYLLRADFINYLGFSATVARAAVSRATVSPEKKIQLIRHTSEVLLKQTFNEELSPEIFNHARNMVATGVDVVVNALDGFKLLDGLNRHSEYIYSHSAAVSLYCAAIARQMGWTSVTTLARLSVGGLLHDIGKKQLPKELAEKPRTDMTPEELLQYESHTHKGAELLAGMREVPTDVIFIVQQHHEYCTGFGYPMHLKRNRIHPMARVVAVANEFCKLVLPPPGVEPLRPGSAIEKILFMHGDNLDHEAVLALLALFKIEAPENYLKIVHRFQKTGIAS